MKHRFPYLDQFRAVCNAHPVAFVVVSFVVAMGVYSTPLPEFALGGVSATLERLSALLQGQNALPASAAPSAVSAQNVAFAESALSTLLAAVCSLALMKLAGLKPLGYAGAPALPEVPASASPAVSASPRRRGVWLFSSAVLLSALVTCALTSCGRAAQGVILTPGYQEVLSVVLLFAVCTLTGLFEETLFRGIMFNGFALGFARANTLKPQVVAAVLSSVVFGVLHVPGLSMLPAQLDVVSIMQMIAKPVQASLFGGIMVALYVRTSALALPVALHFLYDVVTGFPLVLFGSGQITTYVTGSPYDLAAMLCTIAVFATALVLAVRFSIWDKRVFC